MKKVRKKKCSAVCHNTCRLQLVHLRILLLFNLRLFLWLRGSEITEKPHEFHMGKDHIILRPHFLTCACQFCTYEVCATRACTGTHVLEQFHGVMCEAQSWKFPN